MALNIINVSDGITVWGESTSQRFYFGKEGMSGSIYPKGDDTFLIQIGKDFYETKWDSLYIQNVQPSSFYNAWELLSNAFSSNPTPPVTLNIGDTYQGGTIFYIDGTGYHGLIRADNYLTPDYFGYQLTWGQSITQNDLPFFYTGYYIGDGYGNTNLMYNVDSQAANAAKQYSSGGYNDWYVPSYDELQALVDSGYMFYDAGIDNIGAWSSTNFDNGDGNSNPFLYIGGLNLFFNTPVGYPAYVVPIRSF